MDQASQPVRLVVEGAVACSLKPSQWEDALSRTQEFVARTEWKFEKAVGERILAGIYLTVPYYGTTFLRVNWTQRAKV